MTKKPVRTIALDALIQGYLLHAEAARYAPTTIAQYTQIFRDFTATLSVPTLDAVEVEDVEEFFNLQEHVTDATLCKYHTALSSLFTWSVKQQLIPENLMRYVDRPTPEQRIIQPLTQAEVRAMLAACERSRVYTRPGKAPCTNARPTSLRDMAIILTLVDTGVRASELCHLRIQDIDLKNRQLLIFGKGDKERLVHFDSRTGQAIWHYLATRTDDPRVDAPCFVSSKAAIPLDRRALRRLLVRIGERASVPGVHPHRFRHTFAINYLRNGGDIFTLQAMLGHTSLDMVRRYLAIAQVDVKEAHRRASPVANWQL